MNGKIKMQVNSMYNYNTCWVVGMETKEKYSFWKRKISIVIYFLQYYEDTIEEANGTIFGFVKLR